MLHCERRAVSGCRLANACEHWNPSVYTLRLWATTTDVVLALYTRIRVYLELWTHKVFVWKCFQCTIYIFIHAFILKRMLGLWGKCKREENRVQWMRRGVSVNKLQLYKGVNVYEPGDPRAKCKWTMRSINEPGEGEVQMYHGMGAKCKWTMSDEKYKWTRGGRSANVPWDGG